MNLLNFGLIFFSRRLTLPFIVKGGPPYGGLSVERERERESSLPVDRGRQPCQRSPRAATVHILCRGVAVLFCPYALYFASRRGSVRADKRGMTVTLHPQRYAPSFLHDGGMPAAS
jgi:hypothetical protein